MRSIAILLTVLASSMLGLLLPPPAHAQGAVGATSGLELKGGILVHDVPWLWSGFQLERGADVNLEVLFGQGWRIMGGNLRPAVGTSISTAGATSKAYIDVRWEVDLPGRMFLGLGIGAAIHDGKLDPFWADRKALGSRVLFHVPLEIGLRLDARQSISIYFEHMSNGNFANSNEALDSLGVRYGVKF